MKLNKKLWIETSFKIKNFNDSINKQLFWNWIKIWYYWNGIKKHWYINDILKINTKIAFVLTSISFLANKSWTILMLPVSTAMCKGGLLKYSTKKFHKKTKQFWNFIKKIFFDYKHHSKNINFWI